MHLSTVNHVLHFGGRRRNMCAHLANDAFVRSIGCKLRRRVGNEPIGDKLRKHHSESQNCAGHFGFPVVLHAILQPSHCAPDGSAEQLPRKRSLFGEQAA